MKKNKSGEWTATGPLDLIGWHIHVESFIAPTLPFEDGFFIVKATRKDNKETRRVKTLIEAIPMMELERFRGRL